MRLPSLKRSLLTYLTVDEDSVGRIAFLERTSIHGMKHLNMANAIHRVFWLVAVSLGMTFAVYLIAQVFVKWYSHPLLLSLDTAETAIKDIPFPAITFCNMNQVKRSQLKDVEDRLKANHSDLDAVVKAAIIADKCNKNITELNVGVNASMFRDWVSGNFDGCLERLGHSCSDMVKQCIVAGEERDCSHIFRHTDTDFGRCCTFNVDESAFADSIFAFNISRKSVARTDKNVADLGVNATSNSTGDAREAAALLGSVNAASSEQFRQLRAGLSYGVRFILDLQADEYFCSLTSSVGFKAKLHSPKSLPAVRDFGLAMAAGHEYFLSATPQAVSSDESVAAIDPRDRGCYMSTGEKKLAFFEVYSRHNCLTECESNRTLSSCGCVPSHLPRAEEWDVCGPQNVSCAKDHALKFDKALGLDADGCDCLESCNSVSYDHELSSAPLDRLDRHNKAVVNVFFRKQHFTGQTRTQAYGTIDLFSNVGGLLGLCMGFSFLSVIEIFYFLCCGILFAKTTDDSNAPATGRSTLASSSSFAFTHPEFTLKNVIKIKKEPRGSLGEPA